MLFKFFETHVFLYLILELHLTMHQLSIHKKVGMSTLVKNWQQIDMCYDELGLCDLNFFFILASVVKKIGRAFRIVHL